MNKPCTPSLPEFHQLARRPMAGTGRLVLASLLYFSTRGEGVSLHEILITVFLFITAPVSAHLLAKAAMQRRVPVERGTKGKPWE